MAREPSAIELNKLREAIAEEYGIALFRHYREKDAAEIWGVDVSTVKRWRREGRILFIEMPNGGIKYLGLHIVDVLLLGRDAVRGYTPPACGPTEASPECPSTPLSASSAESGTSVGDRTHPPGTGPASIPQRD